MTVVVYLETMKTHNKKTGRVYEEERRLAHGAALCIGVVLFLMFAGHLNQIINNVLLSPIETAQADEPGSWDNNDFGGDGGGGEP